MYYFTLQVERGEATLMTKQDLNEQMTVLQDKFNERMTVMQDMLLSEIKKANKE